MKRSFLVLVLFFSLVLPFLAQEAFADETEEQLDSTSVYLGSYEQDNNEATGAEAIEWFLLDTDGTKGLLVSYYALDVLPFDSEQEDSWNDSSVRKWLNHDFYDIAFTEEEKRIILPTLTNNDSSQDYAEWTSAGSDTTDDKVFLLSAAEYLHYFSSNDKCIYTDYARDRANKFFKETGSWWLRSPGKKIGEFCTAERGKISSRSSHKASGICPAIWVDLSADRSSFPFERFLVAYQSMVDKNYSEAAEIFDTLGTYMDGFYRSADARYQYALASIATEDNKEIINRFETYRQYCEDNNIEFNEYDVLSKDALNSSYYQIALEAQAARDYTTAIEIYTKLGQYEDSMKNLIICFDKTHIRNCFIPAQLVNAGKEGYSDTSAITNGDPHNGWRLGQFLLSGYTDVEEADIPVFIKTPGHNISLWFDLEQNIDFLGGEKKLSIVADPKGQDDIFQYSKDRTDFGRGALLVKHIDFKNNATINLYSNYLVAKETGGANTRIDIREEGTYEVALDYMIKNSDLKSALNSTTRYRLSVTFKVKNGSGMAYLFDIGNKSELQDYSITKEGFQVDLANSKSVKVSYTRYAINQNGTALDARASAPIADGEALTDIGYYILTITNIETNSAIEKHLFVGTEVDFKTYLEVDSSLEAFVN